MNRESVGEPNRPNYMLRRMMAISGATTAIAAMVLAAANLSPSGDEERDSVTVEASEYAIVPGTIGGISKYIQVTCEDFKPMASPTKEGETFTDLAEEVELSDESIPTSAVVESITRFNDTDSNLSYEGETYQVPQSCSIND